MNKNFRIKKNKHVVKRQFICDCGVVLYEKNLTTGKITILHKINNKTGKLGITPIPQSGVSAIKIECANCGQRHNIIDVRENIDTKDNVDIQLE